MGNNYGPIVKFHCLNDCRQEGCPGHEARFTYSRSSDVEWFEVDGEQTHTFDANMLRAALESQRLMVSTADPASAGTPPQDALRQLIYEIERFIETPPAWTDEYFAAKGNVQRALQAWHTAASRASGECPTCGCSKRQLTHPDSPLACKDEWHRASGTAPDYLSLMREYDTILEREAGESIGEDNVNRIADFLTRRAASGTEEREALREKLREGLALIQGLDLESNYYIDGHPETKRLLNDWLQTGGELYEALAASHSGGEENGEKE